MDVIPGIITADGDITLIPALNLKKVFYRDVAEKMFLEKAYPENHLTLDGWIDEDFNCIFNRKDIDRGIELLNLLIGWNASITDYKFFYIFNGEAEWPILGITNAPLYAVLDWDEETLGVAHYIVIIAPEALKGVESDGG